MMKKLMHLFMLSCKKASALIDKKSVIKLSLKENIMLTMHKSMCDACTAYGKQSKLLDKFLHNHIHNSEENITVTENNKLKEKIISRL